MQLGGPPPERRRRAEIPVLERRKEGRRLSWFLGRQRIVEKADSRRDALVVTPQLVDREFPPRALMLYGCLDDCERSGLEADPVVFQRSGERRCAGKPAFGQEPPDF